MRQPLILIMSLTQKCTNCHQIKPFPDSFFRDARRKSGYGSQCKRCQAEYKRQYLAQRRATDPAYRAYKHESDNRYHKTPAGKMSLRRRTFKEKNPSGIHTFTSEDWQVLLEAFGNQCAYCRRDDPLEMDHFIPLKRGGNTIPGNIVPACHICNASKGNHLPEEWCTPEQIERITSILALF